MIWIWVSNNPHSILYHFLIEFESYLIQCAINSIEYARVFWSKMILLSGENGTLHASLLEESFMIRFLSSFEAFSSHFRIVFWSYSSLLLIEFDSSSDRIIVLYFINYLLIIYFVFFFFKFHCFIIYKYIIFNFFNEFHLLRS